MKRSEIEHERHSFEMAVRARGRPTNSFARVSGNSTVTDLYTPSYVDDSVQAMWEIWLDAKKEVARSYKNTSRKKKTQKFKEEGWDA